MLKISHTLVTRHEEIKLVLTRKLFLCWQAFIVPEGATRLLGEKELLTALPIYDLSKLQY